VQRDTQISFHCCHRPDASFRNLIADGWYTFETGNALLRHGCADAVSFGAPFISNPDLVERFSKNLELSPSNPDSYYAGGATGHVDYRRARELVGARQSPRQRSHTVPLPLDRPGVDRNFKRLTILTLR
jgi:hypothetical protein